MHIFVASFEVVGLRFGTLIEFFFRLLTPFEETIHETPKVSLLELDRLH